VDWCSKNNLLIFGIYEYPHESHSDMIKIPKEFLKTKLKMDVMNWHVDRAMMMMMIGSGPTMNKISLI
jgi:hypothetical protein